MPLLTKNSIGAERQAGGLKFVELFRNAEEVVKNGGTITGSPVINNGADLDGTNDYIISTIDKLNYSNGLSYEAKFIPDFAKDDNVNRHIFDTEAAARYYIFRDGSSSLLFNFGNKNVTVQYADYQAYWNDFAENTISFKTDSTTVKMYLNNNQIKSVSAAGWDESSPSQIVFGARNTTFASKFDGKIVSFKWFNRTLATQEITDYFNNDTFNYLNKATAHYKFDMDSHDPTNVQTKDISGNGNHAQFGDGSTPTTYPTKLTTRHGYDFDGGDYMTTGTQINFIEGTPLTIGILFNSDSTNGYLYSARDGATGSVSILYDPNSAIALYVGTTLQGTSTETLATGSSNTVIISYDGTNFYWYLNGLLVKTAAKSGTWTAGTNHFIGARGAGGGSVSVNYNGKIHDVIVDSANGLSAIQVRDLHNRLKRKFNNI